MRTIYSRKLDVLVDKYERVFGSLHENSGVVLDLGCSGGDFLAALTVRGVHAIGIEGDPEAAESARLKGSAVLIHDLENGLPQNIDFRVVRAVLLMDVLEHLRKPEVLLRELCDVLPDGAQILVTGPNVAHWSMRLALLRGKWDYVESGILDRTHFKFFTLATWHELLSEAGLLIIEAGSAEVPPLPASRFFSLIFGRRLSRKLSAILATRFPALFSVVLFFSAVVKKKN